MGDSSRRIIKPEDQAARERALAQRRQAWDRLQQNAPEVEALARMAREDDFDPADVPPALVPTLRMIVLTVGGDLNLRRSGLALV